MRSLFAPFYAALVCSLVPCTAFAQSYADGTSGAVQTMSANERARVELEVAAFHVRWQQLWKASETARLQSQFAAPFAANRALYWHCHLNAQRALTAQRRMQAGLASDQYARRDTTFVQLSSKHSAFSACPSWLLSTRILEAVDEGISRDGALIIARRAEARVARARLIAYLDSAAQRYPTDSWLTGQLVRLNVDQGNFDRAREAAESCRAERWWCTALTGYALARAEKIVEAERAFQEMNAALTAKERCDRADISALLPPDEAQQIAAVRCPDREALVARLWWLSDPLYRVPGNDRYVEQEVRRVEVALRRAVVQDERYSWDDARGGDALAAMVTRFGWPAYNAWAGVEQDAGHTEYLFRYMSPPVAPYTTFEYTPGRIHALPALAAAQNPLEAIASDWMLSVETANGQPSGQWWPLEHFRPARRLVQIDEGQTAFFRRQSHISIATAISLRHAALSGSNSFDVMMVSSPEPGRVDSVAQVVGKGGQRVVLRSIIDTKPTLLSIEAQGIGEAAIDARTRFAIAPPAPLSAMQQGDLALSDPVLLDVRGNDTRVRPSEDLLDRMLATSTLPANVRTVGVFWESYGFDAGDTVTVTVRVARDVSVGRLRRIGIAVNLVDDPAGSITARWTEPDAVRSTETLRGPVPVQMRLLTMNLGSLPPGPYIIEVGMQRKDRAIVRSQRRLTLSR